MAPLRSATALHTVRLRRSARLGLIALFASVGSVAAETGVGSVTLVENGQPASSIIIASNATRYAQVAAAELQTYVEKITGAHVPILSDADSPPAGGRVLVGESAPTRALGYHAQDFQKDEFLVETRGGQLILMGRDTPEYGEITYEENGHWPDYWPYSADHSKREIFKDRGSLFAVYELLETQCGVRWYMVTEIGEVVPSASGLAFTDIYIRRAPAVATRIFAPVQMPAPWYYQGSPLGERSIHTLGPGHQGWRKLFMWLERVRFGGVEYFNNHSLYSYYERFGTAHPDWWADGVPAFDSQLCYADTQVVQQVVQDIRDYFNGVYPEGRYANTNGAWWIAAGGDFHAVVPNDNDHYEACPGVVWSPEPDWMFFGGRGSDYIWQFVNHVASQAVLTHPDKYVAALAYAQYTAPPSFPVEPNIAVMYCKSISQYGDPRRKVFDRQHLPDWRTRTSHLSTWEYYNFPRGDVFPHIAPHRIAEDLAYLHQLGIDGQFIELDSVNPAKEHLNLYCAMKLLDDPSIDIDQLLDEYYTLFYGPAEGPMRQFFERIEQISTNEAFWLSVLWREGEHLGPVTSWEVMCPAATLAEFGDIVRDAYAAVGSQQPYLDRVRLMDYAIYGHMVRSFNQYWNITDVVPGPERVTNGAFDAGAEGWTVTAGRWLDQDGSPDPGCLALDEGDPNAAVVQYVDVEPGRTYRFNFRVRCPAASGGTISGAPRIGVFDGPGGAGLPVESLYAHQGARRSTLSYTVPDGVGLACTEDWLSHTVDIVPGPGAAQLGILFSPGDSSEFRFDGFSLRELLPAPPPVPPETDPNERVVNGEFTTGTAAWTVNMGNWVADAGGPSNGYVRLTNAAAYVLQYVGIEAGERYRFRYRFRSPAAGGGTIWAYPWVRCEASPDGAVVSSAYVYGGAMSTADTYYVPGGHHLEGTTAWQTHELDVIPGSGAAVFRIQFTLGGSDHEFHCDSFSLMSLNPGPDSYYGAELVSNGTFAVDSQGWTVSLGQWISGDGAAGAGCVSVDDVNGYLLQFVPVEPGRRYLLSYRFRSPDAGAGVKWAYPWARFEEVPYGNPVPGSFLFAGVPSETETYYLPDGQRLGATVDWQRHEVVATAGPGASVLRLQFAHGGDAAGFRFDDITLVELLDELPAPRISALQRHPAESGIEIRWSSVGGALYAIESTGHPGQGFPTVVTGGIPGAPPANSQLLPQTESTSAIHRIRAE